MFVITMVFVLGMLAVIQQSLLMYGDFDMSLPARSSEHFASENIYKTIEDTVSTSASCGSGKNNLENNFYELVSYLRKSSIKDGFIINLDHSVVDCSSFGTLNPPLRITPIRIIKSGYIIERNFP